MIPYDISFQVLNTKLPHLAVFPVFLGLFLLHLVSVLTQNPRSLLLIDSVVSEQVCARPVIACEMSSAHIVIARVESCNGLRARLTDFRWLSDFHYLMGGDAKF